MFEALTKVFGSNRKNPIAEIFDPILGTLRWSNDENLWEANVVTKKKTIGFLIGGDSKPDEALIAHAQDIVRTSSSFEEAVSSLLANAAREKRLVQYSKEIQQLMVERICLFWPNRPNDGMIYFKGPDKFRVWRCDYIDRKPTGLGFDS